MRGLGKFKIFTFVKPSATATMSTHRVSMFISEQLEQPLTWDDSVASEDLDTLIIVAGGAVFCPYRDAVGRAALRSERIIFCQNDYQSRLPGPVSRAQTMYRKAFRLRAKRGMRSPDSWSIVEDHAKRTPSSRQINWNMLTWRPTFDWRPGGDALLYYGSWRRNRIPTFDSWFGKPYRPTRVLNNSGRFAARYPRCQHGESSYTSLPIELRVAGLGLYIQDPVSHEQFESPACRFYEMLGAGLPMIFQPECVPMMERAGYDISPYIVRAPCDVKQRMSVSVTIAKEQREWRQDYQKQIRKQFTEAVRSYR
jgi:hypothetical protein